MKTLTLVILEGKPALLVRCEDLWDLADNDCLIPAAKAIVA